MAAALTRRERKVKNILLKELTSMSDVGMLSYAEKQHLEKELDVAYIDEELAKMRKAVRRCKWMRAVLVPAFVLSVVASLVSLLGFGHAFDFNTHVYWPLLAASSAVGSLFGLRATRRKMFIYEALRELSDADEMDVAMSRAVEEADALIRQIVDRETQAVAWLWSEPAKEPSRRAPREKAPSASPKRKKASTPMDLEAPGLSIAEMQRRKEAGSTILSS